MNQEGKADHAEDNPALSHVVERNIRTIIQLRLQLLVSAACKIGLPTPSLLFRGA